MTNRTARQTPAQIRADDPLYTRAEAAEYLRVRRATLEHWASTGRYNLPYFRVGRTARYLKSDLDAWLARHSQYAA
ncbi:helix-turn-helix domain-containing protein [Thiocapsa roseopersicina]|uniref:DNA binding domain-containing protein, excisionase family n=1 Tax=Thiocapsa roseopersicina TaxID=1058 RepID=A0A1H2Y3K2_THIRO|nr:helix-turn-helix domain-containing protein [Thiocapsa roseopersicina]SDW99159.1 DNA binding domain-containing protein, excisionase family [Thiocapsa roseopersicina]